MYIYFDLTHLLDEFVEAQGKFPWLWYRARAP